MTRFFLFFLLYMTLTFADECQVLFFHSPTCPHCANEKIFLQHLEDKYPNLTIQKHDVGQEYERFKAVSTDWKTIPVGVPRTFIRDKVFIGFVEEDGPLEYLKSYEAFRGYQNQIEQEILHCLGEYTEISKDLSEEKGFVWWIPSFLILSVCFTAFLLRNRFRKTLLFGCLFLSILGIIFYIAHSTSNQFILQFAHQFSFPLFTFILALIDGFNPCAFTVLAVLLSLLIYSRSKKKMALIGMIFITTSGFMYFLFIMILLTLRVELMGGYQTLIRQIVGSIAMIAGLINIKDFFMFKKGISLTISEKDMGNITKKMRSVTNKVKEADSFANLIAAVIGTIFLAAIVNLIELGCTLILPVEYLEVLISNYGETITATHIAYTAFYCSVYILPLIAILANFIYSFESDRMTERQGRILKLLSGIIMVVLGLILIFRPEWVVF